MVGVFLFFDTMNTQANQIRPGVKWACVATLFGAVVLLVFFSPRHHKPISSVETTQANNAVVQPAEETNNKTEVSTFPLATVTAPVSPEEVTVEVRMVGISRVAKPPTNSVNR